jgi:serine/threonine protein kinase
MGLVYRARDTRLRRDVALKVLRLSPDEEKHTGSSLLREARAAAALNHPNICTVHEVGEIAGTSFIAMELVAGESLQALVARGRLRLRARCASDGSWRMRSNTRPRTASCIAISRARML